ncbi:G-patch domain-containing protein [Mycena sanguinolenta]|uniref:G-patch domain-containing protein n=1 Tax=Mycena sanguinolenta TaxID=230812 RepID=A0A8H7DJR3_9AGAR|nr:G-patch domain-containing protein [Mycena sanguinolenta]
MGLSGRKVKQRIGNDPRNLAWADDAAKFGASYLSKFGWDSSQGLGASGEGRLSHIKVSQKLDMLGIGAAQQRDPNGIAWKQNKDFERLLERLNAEQDVKTEAVEGGEEEEKKRKREDEDETTAKKKRRKSEPVTEAEVVVAVEAVKPAVPRHRAHRARAIAAKNIASKSAAALAEILGVAATPSTTAAGTPDGCLTPYEDDVPLEKLTTSTKSVADYFKDKLLAKAGKSTSVIPTPSEAIKTEIDYDAPRGGLGSSRIKLEPKEEEPPVRMGLGLSKLSTTMSSFFAASTSAVKEESDVKEEEEDLTVDKKRKSSESDSTAKRKDKKGKRRQLDESESTPAEDVNKAVEKKTKKRREEKTVDPPEDPVDEAARKKAKKEMKRLKKEQAAEAEKAASKTDSIDEDERKRAKKEKKRSEGTEQGANGGLIEFSQVGFIATRVIMLDYFIQMRYI